MECNSYFQAFGENDVLSFSQTNMCKFGKFKDELSQVIDGDAIADLFVNKLSQKGIQGSPVYLATHQTQNRLWMNEGKKCEILKIGAKDWMKGRIKIRVIVEFEPETPEPLESSLDDIRQMIND